MLGIGVKRRDDRNCGAPYSDVGRARDVRFMNMHDVEAAMREVTCDRSRRNEKSNAGHGSVCWDGNCTGYSVATDGYRSACGTEDTHVMASFAER
jgi:hypothetical protein